jgi:hypothetical protein
MERMESPLSDLVGLLVRHPSSASKISFGPVAVRLLECVQALQEAKQVVVDVKPENFMLAYANTKGKGKGKNSFAEQLASRIRILDVALVQSWASIGEHRVNETGKTMVGTPLYASLKRHQGETCSRRDDLEALGYLIAELVIQIMAMKGDRPSSKKKAEANCLPWSEAKSDEEIGAIKQAQVEDHKSLFYSSLGDASVVRVFQKYMDEVLGYAFKKVPDYEYLKEILKDLDIPVAKAQKQPAAAKAPAKKAAKATQAGMKRVTRSRGNSAEEFSDEESEHKIARTATATPDAKSDEDEDWDDAQDESVYWDAEQDTNAAEMDWEVTRDENDDPVEGKLPSQVGVLVCVDDGPHAGLSVELLKGTSESLVIGSNPKTKLGEEKIILSEDSGVDASHVRLNLTVKRKLISVDVTDLNSSGGTFVGSEKIRKGKDMRIFRGQSFCVGGSTISVKQLANPKPRNSGPTVVDSTAEPNKSGSTHAELPRLKRRGVRLVITEGPHEGESFELESGGVESLTVGSKPKATKDKNSLKLGKDKEIGGNHIHLELEASNKYTAIKVTDLKSKSSTRVNKAVIGKGKDTKAFINDQIVIGQTSISIKPL